MVTWKPAADTGNDSILTLPHTSTLISLLLLLPTAHKMQNTE